MANDLLPPDDGLLLPADGTGGKTDDMFDQMSARVAEGAKVLGARASEIAAEQGPVLKEQAQLLGAKMLDAAAQASVTFKDPTLRRGFWQSYKRHLLAGAGALVLIAGGLYGFGCYKATGLARAAVDGFLTRNHLSQQISYQDVSATPFGRVTLKGVKLPSLEIASLSISGLDPGGAMPARLEVGWSGLALPASDFLSGDKLSAFIGSGFQTLKGEGRFSWRLDAGELTVKTAGDFAEAGHWDLEAAFANINRGAFGNGITLLGLASLTSVRIKSLDGSLDLGGLAKRTREIPHANMPADTDQPLFEVVPAEIGNSLIQAGMTPSDARDTADALQQFAQTGARISLKSRTDQPVPLFSAGTLLQPQAINLPALLAATKISLSH